MTRKAKTADKLKIAMLGHKRIPSREGGIEIVVEELSTRMVQFGHSVTCYNRKGHHVSGAEFDEEVKSEYKGVKLKTVPTIEKKGLAAVTSSFFACLFVTLGKNDVVHIHAEGPTFFCWLSKLFRKRVVVTVHGDAVIIGTQFQGGISRFVGDKCKKSERFRCEFEDKP